MPSLSNYPAIDVAIGLMVMFFVLSIVCSAIQEVVATATRLRARKLEHGLRELLGEEGAAELKLNLPTPTPSYIGRRQFSLALLDTLAPEEPTDGLLAKAEENVGAIQAPGVRRPLLRIVRNAKGEVDDFRTEAEEWFDGAMDRVSGWYKRSVQAILIGIAVVMTLAFNIDTFHVANQLWSDPPLRASLVAKADQIVQGPAVRGGGTEGTKEACPVEATDPNCVSDKLDNVAESVADVKQLALPVGWTDENMPDELKQWPGKLAGWVITVFALSLGAPFWFDALGKISRLRATGPKPSGASTDKSKEE